MRTRGHRVRGWKQKSGEGQVEKKFNLTKYVILWVRMYYGFHLLFSGLRYLALQKVPP